VAVVVVGALICCCMCFCLCGCCSDGSQEYTTHNDNRPMVVVRKFGDGNNFNRDGSIISRASRGSRASIASSIRSSIRRLSGKKKIPQRLREENIAMKVTPL